MHDTYYLHLHVNGYLERKNRHISQYYSTIHALGLVPLHLALFEKFGNIYGCVGFHARIFLLARTHIVLTFSMFDHSYVISESPNRSHPKILASTSLSENPQIRHGANSIECIEACGAHPSQSSTTILMYLEHFSAHPQS